MMFWALFMLSRSAFVFKLCFSGFLPNHRMKPGRNDLTQGSCHRLSLSLGAFGKYKAWVEANKGLTRRAEFCKYFPHHLLVESEWLRKWVAKLQVKAARRGINVTKVNTLHWVISYLFIWKSAPLCEVWGCGGGRSFTPVPWPPPEWPLHLKTVPET